MFQKNESHRQSSFFGLAEQLPKSKKEKLEKSKEYSFYQLIFRHIDEGLFKVLYSDIASRPNAPVNTLVASIILMYHHGWTCEELFNQIDFNLLTRAALGLDDLDNTPFCPATFFNFQNRLHSYYVETGDNLLEKVFDPLTETQLKKLKIKTDIQRSDSFMAMSNIASYGRTQLLIEVLIRLYRILTEADKNYCKELLQPYTKQTSGQYLYKLDRSDIPKEQEKLAQIYHQLYQAFQPSYGATSVFQIFERVYQEHFEVVSDKILVRDSKTLNGSILQSPDDLDATYRSKNGKHFRGQSVNVTETAHPENALNLITDVAVCSNNTDDSEILNKRIEGMKTKTEDLSELHTDGAYGSAANDEKMESHKITHVQTAVRGRKAEVTIKLEEEKKGVYVVSCPNQQVKSKKTNKRDKACFDLEICNQCDLQISCPAKKQKKHAAYYFKHSDYLQYKRNHNINEISYERRKIRPNIEATVKEFTKAFNHKGKLRVRGQFKAMIFAVAMAIAINHGRIYRKMHQNPTFFSILKNVKQNIFSFLFYKENFIIFPTNPLKLKLSI